MQASAARTPPSMTLLLRAGGGLAVTGGAHFAEVVKVHTSASLSGDVSFDKELTVEIGSLTAGGGTAIFSGDVNVGGSLSVYSGATFGSEVRSGYFHSGANVSIAKDAHTGAFTSDGTVTLQGNLDATGLIDVSGTFTLAGLQPDGVTTRTSASIRSDGFQTYRGLLNLGVATTTLTGSGGSVQQRQRDGRARLCASFHLDRRARQQTLISARRAISLRSSAPATRPSRAISAHRDFSSTRA